MLKKRPKSEINEERILNGVMVSREIPLVVVLIVAQSICSHPTRAGRRLPSHRASDTCFSCNMHELSFESPVR